MKAREYLSQVRSEYREVRKIRGKLRRGTDESKHNELRGELKTKAAYYTEILNRVWDLIDQVEEEKSREILLRHYVFLEPLDRVAADLACCQNTVYRYHARALASLQKILSAGERKAG